MKQHYASIFVYLTFLTLNCASLKDIKPTWDYEPNAEGLLSPENWYKKYPICAGKEQSPINVNYNQTLYDEKLRRIQVRYENAIDENDDTNYMIWHMYNNGHTRNLKIKKLKLKRLIFRFFFLFL